jgi:hypothetical protein
MQSQLEKGLFGIVGRELMNERLEGDVGVKSNLVFHMQQHLVVTATITLGNLHGSLVSTPQGESRYKSRIV